MKVLIALLMTAPLSYVAPNVDAQAPACVGRVTINGLPPGPTPPGGLYSGPTIISIHWAPVPPCTGGTCTVTAPGGTVTGPIGGAQQNSYVVTGPGAPPALPLTVTWTCAVTPAGPVLPAAAGSYTQTY